MMRFALALVAAFLLMATLARASTNIDNCTTLNTTGETYLLTADILDAPATPACLSFNNNSITLDCQGYSLNATSNSADTLIYSVFNNTIIKNCIISNSASDSIIIGDGITYMENARLQNNTFIDNHGGINLGFVTTANIENNTIRNSSDTGIYVAGNEFVSTNINITGNNITNNNYGIYVDALNDSIITGNRLSNVGEELDMSGTVNTTIYNNLFNFSGSVIYIDTSYGSFDDYFNTTNQSGARIYSSGPQIGGNWWTNENHTGYSDNCTDANTDGFCDNPVSVNNSATIFECAAVADGLPACGNFTDWLPLSPLYASPECTPSWNCTAWSACARGSQTRTCTDDNKCDNETGRPAQSQTCLNGLPNATFNVSSGGCCPISTFMCVDNETLAQVWNTSEGVSWAVETCEFGCDNVTDSCAPPTYQQNLIIFGVIMAMVIVMLALVRLRRR